MNKQTAKAIVKSVNRHMRQAYARETHDPRDMTTGWDYTTWRAVYPQLSAVYQAACESYVGRPGRFVPVL